jgi:hypothetical protein
MADEKDAPDNLGADISAAFDKLESGSDTKQESAPAEGQQEQTPTEKAQPIGEKPLPEGVKQEQKPVIGKDGKPLPPVKKFKAPGSWKPEHREKFAALDPLIQEEIARRESDMDRGMKVGAEARKFKQDFDAAVAPYMHFIQAENSTPIQAMLNMFKTAADLRTETPQNKANIIAHLITSFGVDIQALDQILTQRIQARGGQQPANGQIPSQQINDVIRQQMAPFIQYVEGLRQREGQMIQNTSQQLDGMIEEFATDANNEFFEDVREDMADILEMAANRGQKISLQDAYNRATLLHPTISQIVAQRKLSGVAAQHNAAAERAENAAVSVRSDTPSRSEGPKSNGSLRDDLMLAFDAVERRSASR